MKKFGIHVPEQDASWEAESQFEVGFGNSRERGMWSGF
jgi:hypothetical protein